MFTTINEMEKKTLIANVLMFSGPTTGTETLAFSSLLLINAYLASVIRYWVILEQSTHNFRRLIVMTTRSTDNFDVPV